MHYRDNGNQKYIQPDRQRTWGTLRFGKHPRRSALPVAAGAGCIVAALISLVAAHWGNYSSWWLNVVFFFSCLIPVTIPALWLMLVDRSSITGMVAKPEQSIEHVWLSQAASASFFIVLAATGLASAIATIYGDTLVGIVLAVLTVAMMAIFALSYVVLKNRA